SDLARKASVYWVPAFAGMTSERRLRPAQRDGGLPSLPSEAPGARKFEARSDGCVGRSKSCRRPLEIARRLGEEVVHVGREGAPPFDTVGRRLIEAHEHDLGLA